MLIEDGILAVKDKFIHLRFMANDHQKKQIANVPGVEACFVEKYRVTIYKGKLFDWEEILPSVKDILWEPPQKLVLWYPLGGGVNG